MVIAAKLYTVNVKDPNNAVQDVWERSFKELGDDNPEQITSGMLIFYPHQLVGYLEVCMAYTLGIQVWNSKSDFNMEA